MNEDVWLCCCCDVEDGSLRRGERIGKLMLYANIDETPHFDTSVVFRDSVA